MPLEYSGEVLFCFTRKTAERDSAGDIRGTVGILAAGIDQVDSFLAHRKAGFGGYPVVDDGAVAAIAGDGVEAVIGKPFPQFPLAAQ